MIPWDKIKAKIGEAILPWCFSAYQCSACRPEKCRFYFELEMDKTIRKFEEYLKEEASE